MQRADLHTLNRIMMILCQSPFFSNKTECLCDDKFPSMNLIMRMPWDWLTWNFVLKMLLNMHKDGFIENICGISTKDPAINISEYVPPFRSFSIFNLKVHEAIRNGILCYFYGMQLNRKFPLETNDLFVFKF